MIKNEQVEIEILLEAIYRKYGYDFRNYAKASLHRRINVLLKSHDLQHVSDLIPKIFQDDDFIHDILQAFSITVTEMFRDPEVYLSMRENVIPYLRTYPYLKVWHAGCATGEEVYSSAILLKEENLYDKSTIYATDFNLKALKSAKEGIFNVKNMKKYSENYYLAGGKKSLSEYYHSSYNAVIMDSKLKENIVFAHHNLSSDNVFSETHLIMCRNVMIYFNQELQNRVLQLFTESLKTNGFLIIGNRESIDFSSVEKDYIVVDKKNRIFQKKK